MKHSQLATGAMHRVHDLAFASLENLFAATTVTADIGKVYGCTQGATVSYYFVTSAGSPGTFLKVAQGETTHPTTTDSTETNGWTIEVTDETAILVTAKVIAVQVDGAQRNAYHIQGLFFQTGAGGAVQQGATVAIMTAIESDGAWDCAFDVDANDVRLRITGDAGNDVTWSIDIEITAV